MLVCVVYPTLRSVLASATPMKPTMFGSVEPLMCSSDRDEIVTLPRAVSCASEPTVMVLVVSAVPFACESPTPISPPPSVADEVLTWTTELVVTMMALANRVVGLPVPADVQRHGRVGGRGGMSALDGDRADREPRRRGGRDAVTDGRAA